MCITPMHLFLDRIDLMTIVQDHPTYFTLNFSKLVFNLGGIRDFLRVAVVGETLFT